MHVNMSKTNNIIIKRPISLDNIRYKSYNIGKIGGNGFEKDIPRKNKRRL